MIKFDKLAKNADWIIRNDGFTDGNGTRPKSRAAKRIECVLTTDPGMGVIRHVDAGYKEAIEFARENGVNAPMMK